MKNYAVTEWGTAAAETAEGGFFSENAGAFTYGVYLGRQVGATEVAQARGGNIISIFRWNSSVPSTTGSSTNFITRSNDLHLFFGGDMGVEWGAHHDTQRTLQRSSGC